MPKGKNSEARVFTEIDALNKIAKILAMSVVRNARREDQVTFLHDVGYGAGEIAELLGVPANTVSVALYQHKKKRTRKRPRK